MANIYHFHFNYINPKYHQRIINDDRIIKIVVSSQSKFRHGAVYPDFAIGGVSLHNSSLDAMRELPLEVNANAIIVRDDPQRYPVTGRPPLVVCTLRIGIALLLVILYNYL